MIRLPFPEFATYIFFIEISKVLSPLSGRAQGTIWNGRGWILWPYARKVYYSLNSPQAYYLNNLNKWYNYMHLMSSYYIARMEGGSNPGPAICKANIIPTWLLLLLFRPLTWIFLHRLIWKCLSSLSMNRGMFLLPCVHFCFSFSVVL